MVIVAIIQARVGSTRLPKKVLAEIEGKPMLLHIIDRVKQAKRIDKIIIATTDLPEDKVIEEIAKNSGVEYFAGSEKDVLDRYYKAVKKFGADIIVRITGDCPVVDPELIDKTVKFFLETSCDYASTAYPKTTFPDGLDIWVFSFQALEKAWKEAVLPSEREHVTPYMWKHRELFKIATFQNNEDLSNMRWTVDEQIDLKFIRAIYKRLYKPGKLFLMKDILNLLNKEPELAKINQSISKDEGYKKSLKEDEKSQ